MSIEPDSKDWTWVLERACPECGLDLAEVDPLEVAGMIRANAAAWVEVLAREGVAVRPAPTVWSALEYGCHVRDVFVLFDARLHLMLTDDDARFANWDQDATAVADRYGEQDPAEVSASLAAAAAVLADDFDSVQPDQWTRLGRRSDGATFTVGSFALYLVHDPVHHLWDVTGLRSTDS